MYKHNADFPKPREILFGKLFNLDVEVNKGQGFVRYAVVEKDMENVSREKKMCSLVW